MTISSVRIEMDYAGVGELLRSAEVQADLETRGGNMATACTSRGLTVEGDGGGQVPLPVTVVPAKTKRARVLVTIDHPSGLAMESKYRVLGGSIEAAK